MAQNIERYFDEIDSLGAETPTEEDVKALKDAANDNPNDFVSLDECIAEREYSGKLTLRIPKTLHRRLSLDAKRNGVSLNQYALYLLAKE